MTDRRRLAFLLTSDGATYVVYDDLGFRPGSSIVKEVWRRLHTSHELLVRRSLAHGKPSVSIFNHDHVVSVTSAQE